MNPGKFLRLTVGTVAFFKIGRMKNIGIKIITLCCLFLFLSGCIGTKDKKSKVIKATIDAEVENFDIIDIRTKPNLFELPPEGIKWVDSSFGHTGFTGTMAWADPETEILYIFLSNRTFPSATENRLSKENIRQDIQKVIYESIIK